LGLSSVSDVLLWRNRNLSAGILAGATLVWFLFDVAEYNVVTLLCHVALLGMVLLFVWSNAAPLLDRLRCCHAMASKLLRLHCITSPAG
jgi:hypothetical protein